VKLVKVIRTLLAQPLNRHRKLHALAVFCWWQFRCRISRRPYRYHFTDHTVLILSRKYSAAVINLYYGLHEFNEMGFLLHYLQPADSFADVGANIGAFTVLAAKHIGATAIAIEPAATALEGLQLNIAANHIAENVTVYPCVAGEMQGEVRFTTHLNTMNHVSVNDAGITVPQYSLDQLLEKHQPPALIKIDVEGYEMPVLKGAANLLANLQLNAIIIEVNNQSKRYQVNKAEILALLQQNGFHPYYYDPFTRSLTPLTGFSKRNTIFIRDINEAKQRLHAAPAIRLKGKTF